MTALSNRVYAVLCVSIGLLSAVFSVLTGYLSGDPNFLHVSMVIGVLFVLASGWGVCALVRNSLTKFMVASTLAFAASLVFQLWNFGDSILHLENPETTIFGVTCAMLIAGLTLILKE